LEAFRDCLEVTWGSEAKPMMVRGAIARGRVSATPWQTPRDLAEHAPTRPELRLLFGEAVVSAYLGAERGLKGCRLRVLPGVDTAGYRTVQVGTMGELAWPLEVW